MNYPLIRLYGLSKKGKKKITSENCVIVREIKEGERSLSKKEKRKWEALHYPQI